MKNFELIVDEDITLRLLNEHNAKTLFMLQDKNRVFLREWLSWLDDTNSYEDSKKFIQLTQKEFEENQTTGFGVFYQKELVGMCGLHLVKIFNQNSPEIGYWLDKEKNGRGIINKAVKALVNYGFENLPINRITIRCATENIKSRAIPEKLGFKLEGIIEQNEKLYGRFVDHAHYGMLKENWK